jgi:hypothetical protein
MLVHHVLFWLKPDTTDDQKIAFRASLNSLKGIESVKSINVGTPAPISRPVIDDTYSFSLAITFEDLEGHNVYQVHQLHQAFLDTFRERFEKVIIYDAI